MLRSEKKLILLVGILRFQFYSLGYNSPAAHSSLLLIIRFKQIGKLFSRNIYGTKRLQMRVHDLAIYQRESPFVEFFL